MKFLWTSLTVSQSEQIEESGLACAPCPVEAGDLLLDDVFERDFLFRVGGLDHLGTRGGLDVRLQFRADSPTIDFRLTHVPQCSALILRWPSVGAATL